MQWSEVRRAGAEPFPIVQISGSDIYSQEKAKPIDKHVALASFHACMRIETTHPGKFIGGVPQMLEQLHETVNVLHTMVCILLNCFGFISWSLTGLK